MLSFNSGHTGYVSSVIDGIIEKRLRPNPCGRSLYNCSFILSKCAQHEAYPSSSPVSSSCFPSMLKHFLCHFVQNRMCACHSYANSLSPTPVLQVGEPCSCVYYILNGKFDSIYCSVNGEIMACFFGFDRIISHGAYYCEKRIILSAFLIPPGY